MSTWLAGRERAKPWGNGAKGCLQRKGWNSGGHTNAETTLEIPGALRCRRVLVAPEVGEHPSRAVVGCEVFLRH
eukprot:16439534-Heterocapsa_arctica.AAC.1